jgi:hypothetical protein
LSTFPLASVCVFAHLFERFSFFTYP